MFIDSFHIVWNCQSRPLVVVKANLLAGNASNSNRVYNRKSTWQHREVFRSYRGDECHAANQDMHVYCDMSNRCWTTGCGTSYHENRLLINGRLPSYATVERGYATVRKAMFLRAVQAEPNWGDPRPAWSYLSRHIANTRQYIWYLKEVLPERQARALMTMCQLPPRLLNDIASTICPWL
jgi:hypothetical protein